MWSTYGSDVTRLTGRSWLMRALRFSLVVRTGAGLFDPENGSCRSCVGPSKVDSRLRTGRWLSLVDTYESRTGDSARTGLFDRRIGRGSTALAFSSCRGSPRSWNEFATLGRPVRRPLVGGCGEPCLGRKSVAVSSGVKGRVQKSLSTYGLPVGHSFFSWKRASIHCSWYFN